MKALSLVQFSKITFLLVIISIIAGIFSDSFRELFAGVAVFSLLLFLISLPLIFIKGTYNLYKKFNYVDKNERIPVSGPSTSYTRMNDLEETEEGVDPEKFIFDPLVILDWEKHWILYHGKSNVFNEDQGGMFENTLKISSADGTHFYDDMNEFNEVHQSDFEDPFEGLYRHFEDGSNITDEPGPTSGLEDDYSTQAFESNSLNDFNENLSCNMDSLEINPATGLPMMGGIAGVDVMGNPYGVINNDD